MLIKSVEELLKLTNRNHRTLFIFNLESLDIFKQLRFEEYIYRYITPNCINTAFLLLNHIHPSCSIIFGLSGNIRDLRDINYCRKNRIELIRRFTGGGTVLIDNNVITSSIIATHSFAPNLNPNNITNWAFNFYKSTHLFNQYFNIINGDFTYNPFNHYTNHYTNHNTIGQDTIYNTNHNTNHYTNHNTIGQDTIYNKIGQDIVETVNKNMIVENEKMEYKIGGNAQAYNKYSFVHHTSFIWEVSPRIEEILSIPKKIPKYRNNRRHNEFLKSVTNTLNNIQNKNTFIQFLIQSLSKLYHIVLIHYLTHHSTNHLSTNSTNSCNSTNSSDSSDSTNSTNYLSSKSNSTNNLSGNSNVSGNFIRNNSELDFWKELETKYINDEIINDCINNKLFTNYINF